MTRKPTMADKAVLVSDVRVDKSRSDGAVTAWLADSSSVIDLVALVNGLPLVNSRRVRSRGSVHCGCGT